MLSFSKYVYFNIFTIYYSVKGNVIGEIYSEDYCGPGSGALQLPVFLWCILSSSSERILKQEATPKYSLTLTKHHDVTAQKITLLYKC
jgi:hypothetical protein